ncbi:MAG: hypothetical protein AB4352_21070 [Hormoscilla sp.]
MIVLHPTLSPIARRGPTCDRPTNARSPVNPGDAQARGEADGHQAIGLPVRSSLALPTVINRETTGTYPETGPEIRD